MGVQPPTGDDLDDPDVIEFGIAALDARLESAEISYPADKQTVLRELGDVSVPYDAAGHTIDLQDALERVNERQFDSEQDLLNELHAVFEELRNSKTTGFLGQLRSLVPF